VTDVELVLVLGGWVVFVTAVLTRWTYGPLSRRFGHMRAVYFNRKIIHVLAGGLVAVLVPFFSSWAVPTAAALAIALFLYIPHKTGRLLWWFQDPDNMYEVSFAVMWALVVALSWGDWRLGVVPALFMAVGDSATGVVRNLLFKRRTKHWAGNIAMAAVSIHRLVLPRRRGSAGGAFGKRRGEVRVPPDRRQRDRPRYLVSLPASCPHSLPTMMLL